MTTALLQLLVIVAAAVLTVADYKAIEFLPGVSSCNATLTTSVPAVCQGKVAADQKYDVWKTSYDFSFGRITEEQWRSLRQQYTTLWAGPKILSGQTALFEPHDPSRQYTLKDFLPVTVRALCNHNFEEEQALLPELVALPPPPPLAPHLYNKSVLVPNCWTTVYETLRVVVQSRADDTNLFHDAYSTDDKDAQTWLKAATKLVPGPYVEAKREFGDVMFIFLKGFGMQRAILEHAVVFVDQDIVFEKAGSGNKNPYRLIDLATVEKEWKPTTHGGMFTWELRRPDFGDEQLKTFSEEFSLGSTYSDARWPEFWTWPKDVREWYTLGVADNPRNVTQIDGLTLLKARRYNFRKTESGQWEPHFKSEARMQQTVEVMV